METENSAAIAADDAALFNEVTTPEPTPEVEIQPEQIALVDEATPKPEPEKAEPATERDNPRVPLNELIEERRARQNLERQMAELLSTMKANQPAPPPPQVPEFYEDPKAFVDHSLQPHLQRQQQVELYNSRLIAEARFGEKVVLDAQTEFDRLAAQNALHPLDHAKVFNSPNPFAEVVKWHQTHKAISEIGTDPNAYREKIRSALLNDPEFRKEALTTWQRQAAPTARGTAPPINLPSLQKVGSAALPRGQEVDLNDSDLWQNVTTRAAR